jgi:hypothetical protein
MKPTIFLVLLTESGGLAVLDAIGYAGTSSALVSVRLRNLPAQPPWALGQVRLSGPGGAVKVLSVQMKAERLAAGEEGLVVVETKAPPWTEDKPFSVELVDASGQRRLSLNLKARKEANR